MKSPQEKAALFVEAIAKDAEEKCRQIDEQTHAFRKERLEGFEKEARAKYENEVQYALARMRTQTNREIADTEMKNRADLSLHREELTAKVFAAASEKLKAFTETAQYSEFLKRSVAEMKAVFPDGAELHLAARDLSFAEPLKRLAGEGFTAVADESIALGGILAVSHDGKTTADDTLDARLGAQRSWFLENSGMSIGE